MRTGWRSLTGFLCPAVWPQLPAGRQPLPAVSQALGSPRPLQEEGSCRDGRKVRRARRIPALVSPSRPPRAPAEGRGAPEKQSRVQEDLRQDQPRPGPLFSGQRLLPGPRSVAAHLTSAALPARPTSGLGSPSRPNRLQGTTRIKAHKTCVRRGLRVPGRTPSLAALRVWTHGLPVPPKGALLGICCIL